MTPSNRMHVREGVDPRFMEMVVLNCRLAVTDLLHIEDIRNAGDVEWRVPPAPL